MAPTIPTGSYLLRNQTTGLVVQYNGQGKFELAERDEILHREQQTFWVEPLPEYQFSSSGDVAYTLSQIGMGTVETQVMEIYQGSCDRMAPIGRYRMHGHLTALWKFIRLEDRKDGEFYYILNSNSGFVLEGGISPTTKAEESDQFGQGDEPGEPGEPAEPEDETYLYQVKLESDAPAQIWEFVIPMTPVPVGWLQIKNVSTSHVLSHTYAYSPPRLINQQPPPVGTSNYRETWDTQWTLICALALGRDKSYKGRYMIKNRLTGCLLVTTSDANSLKQEDISGVTVMDGGDALAFELDAQNNWRIRDRERGTLLGEAPASTSVGGNRVEANSKELDPTRSWRLVPMKDIDATTFVPEGGFLPVYAGKSVYSTPKP